MAYTLSPAPWLQPLDDSGLTVPGGLLYTLSAGGSWPTNALATYADSTGTANANPIVLDSAGRCTVYLSPTSYKFLFKTAAGATIRTQDNIGAIPSTDIDNDVAGTAGEALAAGDPVYLSDGSGSLTAGRWYKTDADLPYASTSPEVGFAVAAMASAGSGTIRLSGRVTGLSSLSAGSSYYVSGTAGALTATMPSNARFVGQADSTTTLIATPNPSRGVTSAALCQGRLTLTTAVPVTTADVTAATTLYWTPYCGDQVALYDGTRWATYTLTELSIAIPATTSQMYDVWVYNNAGTLTLELLAWTNDTTRATALTTQNGVIVKTGALTRRYVGSFRTTGVSGQTEDSAAKRYVWNYYHRALRPIRVLDATDSWTYSTATYQQARNSTANQLDVIVGVAEAALTATVIGYASNSAGGVVARVSIGQDGLTPTTGVMGMFGRWSGTGEICPPLLATVQIIPAVGRHYFPWLELDSTGAGTTTWYGDQGAPTITQSGISGLWTS